MAKYFGVGDDVPFQVYITPLDNRETTGEWVSFPTTPENLRDLFARLDIGPSDWSIANVEAHIYGIRDVIWHCDSLDELNYLAAKLEELDADSIGTFQTVIEIDEHCDMPKFEYDKDYPFAAFVTNLGKYNEGEFVGEWVKFPTAPEEMQAVFKRIGIGETDDFGCVYEEWFITDYDCYVDGLYDKLGEYSNIDELNYLASKLDDMMQYDYDKFCAAVYMGDHTSSIQDLINLTENLDCYDVYPDIEDDEELGRYYLEEVDASLVPEHLRNYIDYEAYGRDIQFSDGGEYTDFGYVRDTGSNFVEFYNGDRDDIPEEYRVMNFETELSDEKRSEWAKDLAYDLDEFFRQQDPVYAAENPDEEAAKQALHDQLFDGRIAAIDERLAALGQAANDYLPTRVANYKELIGYEEFLDIDTDALRQAIQNPDPSRVEDMYMFRNASIRFHGFALALSGSAAENRCSA